MCAWVPDYVVVSSRPPFTGNDSAGNQKLNAAGKWTLIRWVAPRGGIVTRFHFQVRITGGSSYTAGTGGTIKADLRAVLPGGQPDMTAAGLVATETFAPYTDLRVVNETAYLNVPGLRVREGDEYAIVFSNTDPNPAGNYSSINFSYITAGIGGAQSRNERDPYATDLNHPCDPRELVGGTVDGGVTWLLPGSTDADHTPKHVPTYLVEYQDGTVAGQPYFTSTGSAGNADGAWVMTYRTGDQDQPVDAVGLWLAAASAGTITVTAESTTATVNVNGLPGYNRVPLDAPILARHASTIALAFTIDHAGKTGLAIRPVYTRTNWASLLGPSSQWDWEATSIPAGAWSGYGGLAAPIWPLPRKNARLVVRAA